MFARESYKGTEDRPLKQRVEARVQQPLLRRLAEICHSCAWRSNPPHRQHADTITAARSHGATRRWTQVCRRAAGSADQRFGGCAAAAAADGRESAAPVKAGGWSKGKHSMRRSTAHIASGVGGTAAGSAGTTGDSGSSSGGALVLTDAT
jgi:hypothetical protein